MFIKNLPKYLFWFTLIVIIISFVTLFIPEKIFCKAPEWLGIFEFESFSVLTLWILLIVLGIAILLLILSIFLRFKKRFLLIAVILAIGGIVFFFGIHTIDYRCPDIDRQARLIRLRTAENMYFEDYQHYANYEELRAYADIEYLSRDPETKEQYSLILADDKQNFEIKAKLDRGGWFICNKNGCEKHK